MAVNTVQNNQQPLAKLKETISKKIPGALGSLLTRKELVFSTGFSKFDCLFPFKGIPCGQLIEITGGISSGKTSFLFYLLAHWTKNKTVTYVDFSNSFFPDSAASSGVNLNKLVVIKPHCYSSDFLKTGIRTAELLLQQQKANVIVFDLVGEQAVLPISLLHRLRLKTVRAKGLIIFLTQNNSQIIPASMVSLCLEIESTERDLLEIAVIKSRLMVESVKIEVHL